MGWVMIELEWSQWMDVLSVLGSAATLVLALLGLNTWKKQLKGTSEYALAKKAILHTYELEHAFQAVRNPMIFLDKEAVENGRRLEEEQRIYDERMNHLYQHWAILKTTRLECKVIWGQSAFDSFNELESCIGKLKAALWLHFWMKGAYVSPGATVEEDPARRRENDQLIYDTGDENEFTQKIRSGILQVEKFYADKVREK
jgi:hypothetical protein